MRGYTVIQYTYCDEPWVFPSENPMGSVVFVRKDVENGSKFS